MVVADQRVAKLGSTSYYSAIARLRREYLDNEVKRALISSATALRIWLDQRPKRAFADKKTNCGKLFPDWPKQKKTFEVGCAAMPVRLASESKCLAESNKSPEGLSN
jgi:hypothetical protein